MIQIQSSWRRYILSKSYQELKSTSELPLYFPLTDALETLSSSPIGPPKSLSYTYASGALYSGSWLGGFRHGEGTCSWPDGSIYSGNWSYGFPFGLGTFAYKDSETYQGPWINPYAHGKSLPYLDNIVQGKRDGYSNP